MAEYIEREALRFEHAATDEEIRAWMDGEITRLGEWFREFTITWHRNEVLHWLEIWSESKNTLRYGGAPGGKCFCVGEVFSDEEWLALPVIQHEGRKLYHRLKKNYPVHRDLGVT